MKRLETSLNVTHQSACVLSLCITGNDLRCRDNNPKEQCLETKNGTKKNRMGNTVSLKTK